MAGDEKVIDTKLISRLETWLISYDHVFLVTCEGEGTETFVSDILRAGVGKAAGRRILLLSAAPVTADIGFVCRQIGREEEKLLLQLYRMYEFADNFSVIEKTNAYGGLFHLVETGVLSVEEAAEALFACR